MIKKILFLLCSLFIILEANAIADDDKALKYFKQGESYYSDKKYEKAMESYKAAIAENSSDGTITIKQETGGRWETYGRTKKYVEGNVSYSSEDYYPNRRITEISDIFAQRAEELEKAQQPPDLSVKIRFSDAKGSFPDDKIQAGEDAEFIVSIANEGNGSAIDTVLEISADNSRLKYNSYLKIGDIPPGTSRTLTVPVKADLSIDTLKTAFQFKLKEKRGYDARKTIVYVSTEKLDKPNLKIVRTEINDGTTGLAKGNGNGNPEAGENVELMVFIQNTGVGKAIGVTLDGLEGKGVQWTKNSYDVGTIRPGDTVKAKLAFTVPRTFTENKLKATLKVKDAQLLSKDDNNLEYAFVPKKPDLKFEHILSCMGEQVQSVSNGEKCDVKFSINNQGKVDAKNVVMSIYSRDIDIKRAKIDIGDIDEGEKMSNQFPISIPRSVFKKEVPLIVEMAQADFPTQKVELNLPMNIKKPKLNYSIALESGSKSLEQNGRDKLLVQVINEGELAAEDVKLRIGTSNPGLIMDKHKEEVIGRIPAMGQSEFYRFDIKAKSNVKLGDALIDVIISQIDFPLTNMQYALKIREEGADVIDVAGNKIDDKPLQKKGTTVQGPTIQVKSKQNLTTEEETYRLALEIFDKTKIEMVRVLLNGTEIKKVMPGKVALPILEEIPLEAGQNNIEILATNINNHQTKEVISVVRKGDDDIENPPVRGQSNPKAYAVIIGISKYKSKDIPPVAFAKNDAETIKKYLKSAFGFLDKNIKTFYDEEAEANQLKSYFKTRLKNSLNKDSELFIFYSGHGVPANRQPYFATYDVDTYDIPGTGFALKELDEYLKAIQAKKITLVIDACFTGKSESEIPLIKDASPIYLETDDVTFTNNNVVRFSSSSGKQVSSWYNEKKHGLFTYYFLKGIKGSADINSDQNITVGELEEYLTTNVPQQARALRNREQTPQVIGKRDTILIDLK